jgi:hypothetical protein
MRNARGKLQVLSARYPRPYGALGALTDPVTHALLRVNSIRALITQSQALYGVVVDQSSSGCDASAERER